MILKVYDHRNLVEEKVEVPVKPDRTEPNADEIKDKDSQSESNPSANGAELQKEGSTPAATVVQVKKIPKTYKTVLRLTQLSLYADLLYQTDSLQLRFTDNLSLNLESEIVSITNRNVNLHVPLNPYHCDEMLRTESKYPYYDEE
ncbi:SPT20 family protein, partial [Acinetobacter baumannii]|nr:SPT20 family protein [Acinetobacter baumannii]